MPRKQNTQSENFNRPFPKALRKIMKENNTTQSELAEACGVARQTIAQWKDGKTKPDPDGIAAIAKFFHVSTDWLLGLSRVKAPNTNLQAVCEYTGLSVTAVEILHSEHLNEVNKLFECPTAIRELIGEISIAAKAKKSEPITETAVEAWLNENGLVALSGRDAAEWHAQNAGNMLRDLINASQRSKSDEERNHDEQNKDRLV